MRLVLLGKRDTIIEKNNSRRDFWRNMKDKEMEYVMSKIINIFINIL